MNLKIFKNIVKLTSLKLSVWVTVMTFNISGIIYIYIFLFEVKHFNTLKMFINLSDDISSGLILALFYFKNHCTH